MTRIATRSWITCARACVVCAVLLVYCARCPAQENNTAHQWNTWVTTNVQCQFAPRWWFVQDVVWRRSDGFASAMQTGVLFAPEYRTGPWSAQLGYGHWTTYPYGEFRTIAAQREQRAWVQGGLQHALGTCTMDHRLRYEHRFLERFDATTDGPAPRGFGYVGRVRYRTRLLIPLNARKGAKGEWQAILSQETMMRFGDPSFKGLFDQTRPALLVGYRPVTALQVTAGYQLQYLVRADGVKTEFNNTLMVGVSVKLPHAAKKDREAPTN